MCVRCPALLALVAFAFLTLLGAPARAHPGAHPTGLDPCDDAVLAIFGFGFHGEGVVGSRHQPTFEPQSYQIVNLAEPGKIPQSIVKIGFALSQGHRSRYADYTVRIDLPTGTQTFKGNDWPSRWLIAPLLHGWSGSMTVRITNELCDLEMQATATWNFPRPSWLRNPCGPCQDMTCRSSAQIGSVNFNIPTGVVHHGLEPVSLLYESEQLTNLGAAHLEVQGPGEFGPVVQKDDNGAVLSVECGPQLARIVTAPTPADPNRFIIRVSSDKSDLDATVFRETTVENLIRPDGASALRLTETTVGKTTVRDYLRPAPGTWVLEDQGLRRTTKTILSENDTTRVTRWRMEEKDAADVWVVVDLREEHETNYAWGWTLTRRIVDPDGEALTSEWDYYEAHEFSGPNADTRGRGLLERESLPTGATRTFEYLDNDPANSDYSQLTIEREAFAGTALALERRRHVSSTNSTLHELSETWIAGTLVEKIEVTANWASANYWRNELHYPAAGRPPLLTRTEFDNRVNSPLLQKTIYPDGTIERIDVTTTGGVKTVTVWSGVENPGRGLPLLTGRETCTVLDQAGQVLHSETSEILGGLAFPLRMELATEFDALSRPTATEIFHGGNPTASYVERKEFGCCGLASQTGQDLLPTTYYYDALSRLRKVHRNGLSTETIYDGLTVRTHLYPETAPTPLSFATPQTEASSATRNLSGDLVAEASRAPHDGSLVTTTYATTYHPGDGVGRRVVQTIPLTPDDHGRAPSITEEYYLDGTLRQRTGSPVVDRRITPGVAPAGRSVTVALLDEDAIPRQAVTTQLDWMGRALKNIYAGDADGDGEADQQRFEYDQAGRLAKQIDPDGVTLLFDYDPATQTTRRALDLNRNGQIDPDLDEVGITRQGVSLNQRNEIVTWAESAVRDLDDTGTGIERLLSRHESTADRLQSWTHVFSGGNASTTHLTTTFLPGRPGAWDLTSLNPDGTSLIQNFRRGLLARETIRAADHTNLSTRHHRHDAHHRLQRLTDTSGPTLQRHYHSPLLPHPARISIGARTTAYQYDARGRRTLIDEPDGIDHTGALVDHRQFISYWPHDAVREISGTPGYRRTFTYDFAQRLETLTTYRPEPATTRWIYDLDRGWLRTKRYHSPTPDTGDGTSYRYSPAARPTQRLSAREITTTYSHGPDGRLSSTTYDDGTPAITIDRRDRLGRIAQLTDGTGTRNLNYTDQGQLATTTFQPGSLLDGWSVSSSYDDQQRLNALALHQHGAPQHQLAYNYDRAGRLASVAAHGLVAHYHYDPRHQLVSQLSIVNQWRPLHIGSRQYDALNRLQRITYHNGNLQGAFVAHSDFHYQRDPYGRISHATMRDGTQWRYGYNAAGELATARRHLTATSPELLAGHSFAWTYDGIGNRTAARRGGDHTGANLRPGAATYNSLNQPTAVQTPGFAEVTGAAPTEPGAASDVLVNGAAASRQGPFFHHELTSNNSGGPVWQPVTITQGGATRSGSLLVPPATTTPQHDLDGNLTSDGIYRYGWDAENRLTQIETLSASVAAGVPYQRAAYTYDSDSRCLQRLSYDRPAPAAPVTTTRFLFAGWRCLGELDHTNSLQRTHAWGLDNDDRLHLGDSNAALLWIHDHPSSQTHLASYDGNGNLTGLLSAQTGQPTATYTYSPFGQLLTSTGPYADQNPYRFSTKPFEPVGSLYNYGFRHYQPTTGRWLSRDPLAEDGGLNLYGFLGNDPIQDFDLLGERGFLDWAGQQLAGASSAAGAVLRYQYHEFPKNVAKAAISAARAVPAAIDFAGTALGNELLYATHPYYDHGQILRDRLDAGAAALANLPDYLLAGLSAPDFWKDLISDLDPDCVEAFLKQAHADAALAVITAGVGKGLSSAKLANRPISELLRPSSSSNLSGLTRIEPRSPAPIPEGSGPYSQVRGHHVHAKAGFRGHVSYDPRQGFSISQDFMSSRAWSHTDMTRAQRRLFDDLARSGGPNTMTEHTRIAVEALIEGGATRAEARALVTHSLRGLRNLGVRFPTRIPWNQ